MSSLRKVVCVICGGIFKVEADPPIEIAEPVFDREGHPSDAYRASAIRITDDDAGRAYCRLNCAWRNEHEEEDGNDSGGEE